MTFRRKRSRLGASRACALCGRLPTNKGAAAMVLGKARMVAAEPSQIHFVQYDAQQALVNPARLGKRGLHYAYIGSAPLDDENVSIHQIGVDSRLAHRRERRQIEDDRVVF